jgi:hypothetical protein
MLTDLNQACGVEAEGAKPLCTRAYVDAYFKLMVDPIMADYQWTDSPKVTTFTNELYVRYPGTKKKKRTINFSRYGGLGQVNFRQFSELSRPLSHSRCLRTCS